MTQRITWTNEINTDNTADLWAWVLDQDAQARDALKHHGKPVELERLTIEKVWVLKADQPFDPDSDFEPEYAASISYEVKA